MPNVVFGFREDGSLWMDSGVDVRGSDQSAVPGVDGWGSMCSALGNLILQTAEEGESTFPVRHLGRELTTDTGGAGQWRGGCGTRNIKQMLAPANASCWMVSMKHPLRGMQGGDDAAPYENRFMVGTDDEYVIDNAAFNVPMPEGAVIAYQYGGGGGFGDPLERDPEAVREDVLDELVSVRAARERYGVVLTGSLEDYDLAVDVAATGKLRADLRARRAESGCVA